MKNRKKILIIVLLVIVAAAVALVLLLPKQNVNNTTGNTSDPTENTADPTDDPVDDNPDDVQLQTKSEEDTLVKQYIQEHADNKMFTTFLTETADWLSVSKKVNMEMGGVAIEDGTVYVAYGDYEGVAAKAINYKNKDTGAEFWCGVETDEENYFCVGTFKVQSYHRFLFSADYTLDKSSDLSNKIILKMITKTFVGYDEWGGSGDGGSISWDGGSDLDSLKTIVFTKGE